MSSRTDKSWQADYDANTMAEYQEIMSDSKRKAAAIRAAKKIADDLNKRATAMRKAAGGKITRKK